MGKLRVGSRGSDLAVWQTNWVCERIREKHPGIEFERVIIKTHGDLAPSQPIDKNWPAGGFTGAIEAALLNCEIDFGVHSLKDLPSSDAPGLVIAAVPVREVAHDVLITRRAISLKDIGAGFRIGTGSPRRVAQFKRIADVEAIAIRGNVPSRVAKLESEQLDGVVLAAAGLKRLGINPPHRIELAVDRFVPAAGQGALAVQTRESDDVRSIVGAIEDFDARRCVDAERAFLRAIDAGCHTAVGALCEIDGAQLRLRAQLFSDDFSRCAEEVECGVDPTVIGEALGVRLKREID